MGAGVSSHGGRAYLSSADVRLSISVITSAISYFSLCRKRRTDVGAGPPPPSSRLRAEPLLRSCLGPQGGDTGACHWPSQSRPVRAAQRRSRRVCARPPPRGAQGCTGQARGVHAQGRPGHWGHRRGVKGRASRFGHAAPCARLPPASGRCVPGTARATGDVNAFRTGSPRPDHDRQRPRGRGDRRATRGPLHGRGEQEVRRPLPSAPPSAPPCLTQSRVPLPADAGATLPGRRGLCFTDLDTSRSVPPCGSVCGRQTLIFYVCTKPPDLLFYLKANTERFSYLDVINKFLFSSTNV